VSAAAPDTRAAEEAILGLLAERREGATICPSEAARRLSPEDWRPRMAEIHEAARRLAGAGRIEMRRKGRPVAPGAARGPVRLALPGS
jgi:hypothetical protein